MQETKDGFVTRQSVEVREMMELQWKKGREGKLVMGRKSMMGYAKIERGRTVKGKGY